MKLSSSHHPRKNHWRHTPRWSPDGSKIAYLSDRGRGLEVFSIPVTGGAEKTLAATNIEYLARWDGVYAIGATPWSPNGKLLLFSQVLADRGMGISRVEVATGRLERLTSPPPGSEDLEPSGSFDGRWVAFSRWAGGRVGIWLMPAEGGEARPLLSDEHSNRGPAITNGTQPPRMDLDRSQDPSFRMETPTKP